MTKNKMFLKIELLPKEHPCHNCVKGCMGDEFLKCKKLKAFENKKICQAYDYDKAVNIAMNAIIEKRNIVDENSDAFAISKEINYCNELSKVALKALLEGGKNEK